MRHWKVSSIFRLTAISALIIAVVPTTTFSTPVLADTYTVLTPIADGSFINLNVSGGSSNWAAVDGCADSLYVWGNDNGWSLDAYEMSDVAPEGIVNSVTVWIRGRANAPITQTGAWPSLRTYGFTYPVGAPTQVTLTTEWAVYDTVFTTNPYTGESWTWDEINNLEAGVRLRTSDTGSQSQVDCVRVLINYGSDAPPTPPYAGSNAGCFIATAAYGTPMAEDIDILRDFRDQYLLTNPVGEALVEIYYKTSPPIADIISDHPALKPVVRTGLKPIIVMSSVVVNTTLAQKLAILSFLVLVSSLLVIWLRRRASRSSVPQAQIPA